VTIDHRPSTLIEACIDDLVSARHAVAGGADRLELCDNLSDGGTTPSHGIVAHLLEHAGVPVFPIVRLRGGGFRYAPDELDAMLRDVRHLAALGVPGLVFGALTDRGGVDREAMARVREAAPDVALTFHRAFDTCRDPYLALETLVELGVARILTSGQRARAWEGRDLIAELVRQAGTRIVVMAGGGISEQDAGDLVHHTGVTEIHVRATMTIREAPGWESWAVVPFRKALPGDEHARLVTDPHRIAAIRKAVVSPES
jgi:copper homeostasis protein